MYFSLISLLFFLSTAIASGVDDTADYIVPTSPELVPYSRFKVDILKSYTGTSTSEIAYRFPKELTGEPGLVAIFQRVYPDLAGSSRWDSPFFEAVCTDTGSQVTCNIYVKKASSLKVKAASLGLLNKPTPIMDSKKAVQFIKTSGKSEADVAAQLSVLDDFLFSEPGGILTYEY